MSAAPATASAPEDVVSRTFAALADPTRRQILHRLTEGEASVSELAEPFALTQQAISRHVKVLEDVGLISRSRVAQTRPCRLEPDRLALAADWIAEQRELWTARHEQLAEHLDVLARGTRRRSRG